MSTLISYFTDHKIRSRVLPWLAIGMLLSTPFTSVRGQVVEAYAKPKEDYNYVYTLDHQYETTLFRSEQFETLVETEEGYIIMLQLGGKPNLVLLPFDSGDRKIAEQKHRGVGVTYTAYLTFTQGQLPFFADQYYEVLKREKGMVHIDYNFKGFRKTIQVPESRFIVKSAFEYHLEESLEEVRSEYRKIEVTVSPPEDWQELRASSGPGTLTESPTHIGQVKNTILATNYQSIRTSPATELQGVAKEVWVDRQKLLVVPILYTHETLEHVYYFLKVRSYDRPVLVKDFKAPEGGDGYSRVVRISSNSEKDVRYLEITEAMNVEFYPNFHFLSPGELVAVREGFSAYYLIATDGEYEIPAEDMDLQKPNAFLQMWGAMTARNQLNVSNKLYNAFLKLRIPAVAKADKEWQSLHQLQSLAQLNKTIQPEEGASVHTLSQALANLEAGAERLSLSLSTNPKRTFLPVQNHSYFQYWKTSFDNVNAQAVREGNQDVLRRQILRAKILSNETQHQALVDFLSAQIYTYSNYLPAPLNRINQLDTNPPLAASNLMVFSFPLDESFKLNPESLEPIALSIADDQSKGRLSLKEKFNPSWLLNIDILQFWQATIISKKEEVYDPAYWKNIEEKSEAEKEQKLQIARKRLIAAQTAQIPKEGVLNSPEAPWVAAAIWFVIILMTNTGFFALSKAMPIKQF
jgi:hypothetical protein